MLFFASLLFVSLLAGWRLWITRDTTGSLGPKEALAAVRLFKTKETVAILSQKFSGKELVSYLPIEASSLFSLCQTSCTFWINQKGAIDGMTTDREFSQQTQEQITQYGFIAVNQEGNGFLGKTKPEDKKIKHGLSRAWHRLFPWNDGEFIDLATQTSQPISLNEQGVQVHIGQKSASIPDVYLFPTDVRTTSDAIFSAENDQIDAILSFLALQGGSKEIASAITEGVRILTGTDHQGSATALIFPEKALTDAGTEIIAKSLLARDHLATQELTFKDGTAAAELRSDLTDIQKIEGDGKIIWKDAKGNEVFLQKDHENGVILIANRKLSQVNKAISHTSACFPGSLSFAQTDLLKSGTVLELFREIAWDQNKIKACW